MGQILFIKLYVTIFCTSLRENNFFFDFLTISTGLYLIRKISSFFIEFLFATLLQFSNANSNKYY